MQRGVVVSCNGRLRVSRLQQGQVGVLLSAAGVRWVVLPVCQQGQVGCTACSRVRGATAACQQCLQAVWLQVYSDQQTHLTRT